MHTFKGQDPSLQGSCEYDFLEGLVKSMEAQDKSLFEKVYTQFKKTNSGSFDPWNKAILNKIYEKMQDFGGTNQNDFLGNEDKIKVKNNKPDEPDNFL